MKTLGLDLGTNSTGLSLKNPEKGTDILEQLEFFSSVIFKTGVGKDDKGSYTKSYAAERTKKRSVRRLYQARKYRIWETLKVLIEFGYCSLSPEDFEKWSKYDKKKGLKRKYPIGAIEFEQWVRLDFNGDGVADYSSPFELRAELATKQFDFTDQINKYKLGRALYHIAQRRGFKSSKGETLKEQEKDANNENEEIQEIETIANLKKSEEKKSKDLVAYMQQYNLKTVGCAFDKLLKDGVRVRASEFQAVRSQYKKEIIEIFKFQNELSLDSDFFKRIISEKKKEGTIFFKRPLRSQKGLIGKCTLEPTKHRCPISHPEFEKFRALCFINNIKYRRTSEEKLDFLNKEQKEKLFNDKFLRASAHFKFEEIRNWIEKEETCILSYDKKTINYKDNTNVSGCPISGRLNNLLGNNWQNYSFETNKERKTGKNNKVVNTHTVTYKIEDIWHICFSYDEAEQVEEFAKTILKFDEKKASELARVWGAIQQGYGQLSLKAIRNINRFLEKGLIYTDAVLLAKLPEILGEKLWSENENLFLSEIGNLTNNNREEKRILNIVNNLIANYKALDETEQFAFKNREYIIDNTDYKDIEKYSSESIGEKTWDRLTQDEKNKIIEIVAAHYQTFFKSNERDFVKLPKLGDAIKSFLSDHFDFLHCPNNFIKDPKNKISCDCNACKKLNKIYHPSLIEFYSPAKEQQFDYNGIRLSKKLLESPVIGAFKNPMAMRALHILRKKINELLKDGIIDEDTRIVVETARDLNDANMRWALDFYNREREKENKEFEKIINQYYPGRIASDDDIDKARLLIDQHDIPEKGEIKEKPADKGDNKKKKKKFEKVDSYKKDITKYRLWLEQGCRCIYTGKVINIESLFNENAVDFEHTIPRSLSFDNSLANLTICDYHYNRQIKKNQIPTALANYDKNTNEYTAILPRLQPWFERIEKLKDNIEFCKGKSKQSQDKEWKDHYIRQRHLWQMELEYWQNKADRFTMTEVTTGFRNSQLVDTRLISKYAFHYLKSVFNNVDVQKGSATAAFRKLLGIQSMDEKKSRDKHSHHAIDATMLTLIPVAAKRDKMLKLFYQIEEKQKFNEDPILLKLELEKEIRCCHLGGNISAIPQFIEENILIDHISNDQTLTPASKRVRIRGKIVPLKDENGKVIYEKDENGEIKKDKYGNKVPLAKYWKKGDNIRGQLHGETFYGAITQAQKENGKILRNEDGSIKIGSEIFYVVRRELKFKKNEQEKGFRNWEELENTIVDKALYKKMRQQFANEVSFKDAIDKGIFMIDKNGKVVNKIRHIRCYTSQKNPLAIKKQTYLSDKDYKQSYYSEVGDLYVMCKYENETKTAKEYVIYSLFDISENRKNRLEDVPTSIMSKKGEKLTLNITLKKGVVVLLFRKSSVELKEMDNYHLSKRLYTILGFENPSLIKLKRHINSQPDKDLGKGESVKVYNNLPEKIRCGINTLNFLIENKDFTINTNEQIVFE